MVLLQCFDIGGASMGHIARRYMVHVLHMVFCLKLSAENAMPPRYASSCLGSFASREGKSRS